MKTSNAKDWQAAVDFELDTLCNNQTWVAMPTPKTAKPLHSKWAFKTKMDANGKIERFKARLVACGVAKSNNMASIMKTPSHLCLIWPPCDLF